MSDQAATRPPRVTTIKVNALIRRFGAFTAVHALMLSVNAGEAFALLGSNGAGKTTEIKMLTTLLRRISGEALISGLYVTIQAVEVRRVIGYVWRSVFSADGSLTAQSMASSRLVEWRPR